MSDDSGKGLLKCYTYSNSHDKNKVKLKQENFVPYITTREQAKQIMETIKNWQIKKVYTIIENDYQTKEQKYKKEQIDIENLSPGNVIIEDGKIVGYYFYIFYNKHINFVFESYNTDNPPIYTEREYYTVGAYYYRPPHSEKIKTYEYMLVPKNK